MIKSLCFAVLGLAITSCATVPHYQPIAQAYTHLEKAKAIQADLYFPAEYENAKQAITLAEKSLYNYNRDQAKAYADEGRAWADLAKTKTEWQISQTEIKQAEEVLQWLTTYLFNENNRLLGQEMLEEGKSVGAIQGE